MDEKLRQLSINARILGLMYDKALPPSIRAIFKQADEPARPLSDHELRVICRFSAVDADNLQRLQSKTPQFVTSAKNRLLEKDPSLNLPGGALYPEERAEACWRDCWHFLRVTIYAVAAGRPAFTQPGGVQGLSDLYRELAVPISSMALAIGFLKSEAVSDYSTYASPSDASILREALLHLEQMIQKLPQRSSSDTEVPL
jgi:hypothetical protein